MMVSIIIPVYNVEKYIVECMASVARQTMQEGVECILVDDCGQDDSIQIACDFIDKYDGDVQFSILHQKYNQGPSAARNAGLKVAKGKYIYFLDSDDKISLDCIDNLYNLASIYDADYVQGTYQSGDGYNMPKYSERDFPTFTDDRAFIKSTLLNYNIIPFTPHNRLIKKQLIIDNGLYFNENVIVHEDFHWMFFMAKYVERLAVCRKETYIRVYSPSSLSHDINIEREISAYRCLLRDFTSNIDPFLKGWQKELIVNTLIMALDSCYYHDEKGRDELIDLVMKINSPLEKFLLSLYMKMKKGFFRSKILHLLCRLYKFEI